MNHLIHTLAIIFLTLPAFAQNTGIEENLQFSWKRFEDNQYVALRGDDFDTGNTIYFNLHTSRYAGGTLVLKSARPFFIFLNGKVCGEYNGSASLNIDSLATLYYSPVILVAVHQKNINRRDLKTLIMSNRKKSVARASLARPATYFKDFVIIAGLTITILFLVITRLNPKLATDYFSVIRIFSLREAEDAQSNARLTSSTNVQFYISCSLLLGFYLLIIFYHLPDEYALPLYFQGHSFAAVVWQWVKLSAIIFGVFLLKILFIFSLTRLFGMRGMARIHFFNWMRLLLIIFGSASLVIFVYYISRGQSPDFFVGFLLLLVASLTAWIVVVFLKLNGKSEHTMFHLFSYICATEIIPLLVTIKVLFQ